ASLYTRGAPINIFLANADSQLLTIRRNRRELCENDGWFLHHDNAPSYTAVSIQEFLAEKNIPVIPHPPFSPDLAPCDFLLFPKIKMKLKGRRFDDIPTIHKNVEVDLKKITDKCVSSGGDYVEGDSS
uniref:Tc1-like transposase DDE domain-containing protein n=1 Tax=Crocodylus porosus TaxID=8502 RepID=A0A7M4EV86_CROPO